MNVHIKSHSNMDHDWDAMHIVQAEDNTRVQHLWVWYLKYRWYVFAYLFFLLKGEYLNKLPEDKKKM